MRRNEKEIIPMNGPDWKSIPASLRDAGFTLFYERISYDHWNPLWRARAQRAGQEWSSVGRDLETALLKLQQQTSTGERLPMNPLHSEHA